MRKFAFIFAVLLVCAGISAAGQVIPGYQEGTIHPAGKDAYELRGEGLQVWMNHCGEFQPGQSVQYRIEGDRIHIRDVNGKDYDCSMTQAQSSPQAGAAQYQTGEILGYNVRRDIVEKGIRLAKVYEMRGPTLIYLLDYCGSFQAGKFFPGQIVQFRADVDNDRISVRSGGRQYSCQLEGMRLIQTDGSKASELGSK